MDEQTPKPLSVADYNSPVKPTWCPGCGNFAIFNSLKMALVEKGLKPTDILLVFDIGCNGNGADKINAYGFKGLHGRAIPAAAGAKIANSKLNVVAMGGDGGTLDEGMHHFIHGFRNNYDITFLMHDNFNFGLTTGQETPTTPKHQPMPISPWGVIAERVNPMHLALVSGATFVASGWTGNQKQLKDLIVAGMNHKGMSFIHIYQHCPTYNKFEDQDFIKDRVYDISTVEGYDPSNWNMAFQHAAFGEKRATGILYQDKNSIDFLNKIPYRNGVETTLVDEVKDYDVAEILEKLK